MRLIDGDALFDRIGDMKDSVLRLRDYSDLDPNDKAIWDKLDEFQDMVYDAPTIDEDVPTETSYSLDNVVGRPIYKIRMYQERKGMEMCYRRLIEFPWMLELYAKDPNIELVVEERTGYKADLKRMGITAFFTREDAEKALRKARGE